MKKHLFLLLALAVCLGIHAESYYLLKQHFADNILKLDPIEGIYDCDWGIIQYLPYRSPQKDVVNNKYAIKKVNDIYHIIAMNTMEDLYPAMYITKTTEGIYMFYGKLDYDYTHHQRFSLQNESIFDASYELSQYEISKLFSNTPSSNLRAQYIYRGIKTYPTSSMYLEAAKEDARKAEQEYQKALEEAQKKAGWSGSGFALNRGHIVTNYHVVEDAKTILVKGIRGNFNIEYKAKVVVTDKVNDIAIVKIEDERFKGFGEIPYKIKRSMSEVGESVWALGYPMTSVMGEEIKFTDGKISSRTGVQGDMSVYQISVPIQPGNSGGALFDNYGNIVGITSSGLNREAFNSENVNYAIKTSYLYNLVESSLSTSILPQGNAMQGQSLTQKIKLAKNFVFMILCSSDPNSHKEKLPIQNNEANSANVKAESPSNASSVSKVSESKNKETDKSPTTNEIKMSPPETPESKPILELDKHSYDFGSILECNGPVETTFRITNKGESKVWILCLPSSESIQIVPANYILDAEESETIRVTYNPEMRPGKFSETITFNSNALYPVAKIDINGEVLGRQIIRIDKNGDSTIVFSGSVYSKDAARLAISRITLNPDFTRLDCSYTSGSLSIDKKTYLKTSNGKKYKLKAVENIPYNPDSREVPSGQQESFSLCFTPLPEGIDKFDLIENAKPGWKIYDIEIK